MADSDRMPKLDMEKHGSRLTQTHLDYMKKIEKRNLQRVLEIHKVRRNNVIAGCLLAGGVLSIYLYSIFAVKQESFLDDFNEPVTSSKTQN